MKIFIAILLLFPLLLQAGKNKYAKECKKEYLKERLDMFAVESSCKKAAKYEENNQSYENASWFYLLGGDHKYITQHLKKYIDKNSKVIYGNLGHSYILESKFDKAQKMYEKYLNLEYSPDKYMQEDYKLLFKLYPDHKKQLRNGLTIWNELYSPVDKISKLMIKYQYSIKNKDDENYKKTDEDKINYLSNLIEQQEKNKFRVEKHIKINHRLLIILYIDMSKIYEKKLDYFKQIYYYKKAVEKVELLYRISAPSRLMEVYDKIVKQYEKIQDYENALKYAVKSFELKEKTFGFEYIGTFDSCLEVSSLCTQNNEHKKSIIYYKKIMLNMEKDLDVSRDSKAEVYRHIAGLYANAEDNINAIKYYKKSLEVSGFDYKWLY